MMPLTDNNASLLGSSYRPSIPVNTKRLICCAIFLFSICRTDAIPASRSYRRENGATRTRSLFTSALKKWQVIHNRPISLMHPTSTVNTRRLSYSGSLRKSPPDEAMAALQASYDRSRQPMDRKGLTFEFCCEDDDCRGSRVCEGFDPFAGDVGPCSFATELCRCLPPVGGGRFCDVDADCPKGEICAVPIGEGIDAGDQLCISALAAPSAVVFAPVNESLVLLSGEPCLTSSQCAGRRVCDESAFLVLPSGPECSTTSEGCLCRMPDGPVLCDSDDDCVTDGEVCAVVFITGQRVCASKALVDGSTLYTHQGLTGEFCFADRECLGKRECLSRDGTMCTGDCVCTLRDAEKCETSDDCVRQLEICARARITGTQECVSQLAAKGSEFFAPPATPQPEDTSSPGMIVPIPGPMLSERPVPATDMTESEVAPSSEFTSAGEPTPSIEAMPCD